MDLALDSKQSKALTCTHCDLAKMQVRNCRNQFGKSKSPILVNDTIYRECPRSMVADKWELGYLVSLFFDCKENKTYPYGNSLMQVTAFCKEAFDFMDEMVSEYKQKQDEKHKREMEKANKRAKTTPRRGR